MTSVMDQANKTNSKPNVKLTCYTNTTHHGVHFILMLTAGTPIITPHSTTRRDSTWKKVSTTLDLTIPIQLHCNNSSLLGRSLSDLPIAQWIT